MQNQKMTDHYSRGQCRIKVGAIDAAALAWPICEIGPQSRRDFLGSPTQSGLPLALLLYFCLLSFFSNPLFSAVVQRTPIKYIREVRS